MIIFKIIYFGDVIKTNVATSKMINLLSNVVHDVTLLLLLLLSALVSHFILQLKIFWTSVTHFLVIYEEDEDGGGPFDVFQFSSNERDRNTLEVNHTLTHTYSLALLYTFSISLSSKSYRKVRGCVCVWMRAVWPDIGIKVAQIFTKLNQKRRHSSVHKNVLFWK